MACKPNEIAILKSTFAKVDPEHTLILAMLYHTADKDAKRAGVRSFYRYEALVLKNEDIKQMIAQFNTDPQSLEKWVWQTKDSWWKPEYFMSYDGNYTNKYAAKWFSTKMKKALSWAEFMNLAKNGIKKTARGVRSSMSAKYELNDYTIESTGEKVNLDDPAVLLAHVNQNMSSPIVLKRDIV